MFGTLGGPELFLIFVVALIVFGPRKLPEIGKSLGRMMGEFRKASNEFRSTIESEVEAEKIRDAMRIEPISYGGGPPLAGPTAAAPASEPASGAEPLVKPPEAGAEPLVGEAAAAEPAAAEPAGSEPAERAADGETGPIEPK